MVENPLAFEFSKTRTICDAFDQAWAFLQGLGSDLTIQLARDANDPGQAHHRDGRSGAERRCRTP
jgi:hypothetical protein